MTKTMRVLSDLLDGKRLSATDLSRRYGVANPSATIHDIRKMGYPVYLNQSMNSRGQVEQRYRIGAPSRAVIAAGYRALGSGYGLNNSSSWID